MAIIYLVLVRYHMIVKTHFCFLKGLCPVSYTNHTIDQHRKDCKVDVVSTQLNRNQLGDGIVIGG